MTTQAAKDEGSHTEQGIPGAVAGFGTCPSEKCDGNRVLPDESHPPIDSVQEVIPEVMPSAFHKQHVGFFQEAGFSVTPQDLLDQRLVVVNAVESTVYADTKR